MIINGDDLRRHPLRERKLALGKLLLRSLDGIQYVEHAEGHGDKMFAAVCQLGLEGIVSNSTPPIARDRRTPGSKSKIRKRLPLRGPPMAHSEVSDVRLVLASARKSRGAEQ